MILTPSELKLDTKKDYGTKVCQVYSKLEETICNKQITPAGKCEFYQKGYITISCKELENAVQPLVTDLNQDEKNLVLEKAFKKLKDVLWIKKWKLVLESDETMKLRPVQ